MPKGKTLRTQQTCSSNPDLFESRGSLLNDYDFFPFSIACVCLCVRKFTLTCVSCRTRSARDTVPNRTPSLSLKDSRLMGSQTPSNPQIRLRMRDATGPSLVPGDHGQVSSLLSSPVSSAIKW